MNLTSSVDLVSTLSAGERTEHDYTVVVANYGADGALPDRLLAAGALVYPFDGKLLVCGRNETVDRLVPERFREPARVPAPSGDLAIDETRLAQGLGRQLAWFSELGHHRLASVWSMAPGIAEFSTATYRVADGNTLLAWAIEGHEIALTAACAFFVLTAPNTMAVDPHSIAKAIPPHLADLPDGYAALKSWYEAPDLLPSSGSEPEGWLRTLLEDPKPWFQPAGPVQGPFWGPTIDMLRLQRANPTHVQVVPLLRALSSIGTLGRWTTNAPADFLRAWQLDHAPHAEIEISERGSGGTDETGAMRDVRAEPGLLLALKDAALQANYESLAPVEWRNPTA